MRLLLLGFLMLCVCSFTHSIPAQGRDVTSAEASAESEALADSVINDDAEEDEDETQQMQSTTASTDLRIIEDTAESWDLEDGKRVSGRRRKTNRRVKTTNRYNKLNSNKDKRKRSKKRRPSNSKKGISKTKPKAIAFEVIQFDTKETQRTNQNADALLVLVSQYLRESSGFSFKLATLPNNIKAKPWGYVVLETSGNASNTQPIERIRSKRESDNNENDGDDSDVETDEDAEVDEDSNDEKEESTTLVPEDIKTTSDSTLMEGEQTAPNKEEADLATDEDEEEDEEEFFTKDTASSNSTNQDQTVLYETPVLSQIPQPIKQSDGSQVYHLQLLDEDVSHEVSHDVSPNVSQASEPNSFKSRTLDDIRAARKQGDKFTRPRHQRRFRLPKARVNGLELMKRSGDVTAGTRNGTEERVYEIPLSVGPINFSFNESTVVSMPVSRVSTSVLKARLRLKERDGKLVSLRIKATKMRPNNVVVSLKVTDERSTFDDQTARLVTHLSQEVARAWNSGALLRQVKRSLKRLLLTGPKVDERTSQSETVKDKAEKLLHDIFQSPGNVTSSSTVAPVATGTGPTNVTPVPSVA